MVMLPRLFGLAMLLWLSHITAAQNNTEVSAYWGEWGEWSVCSRTCGGGITAQLRECIETNNQPSSTCVEEQVTCTGEQATCVGKEATCVGEHTTCVGEQARHLMCNIQDCPDGSIDYRMSQCSNYDKKIYKGKYYKWAAFAHDAGECELKCMPKDKFFYVTFQNSVADGTRCNQHTNDVCVNGTCVPVGCDMQLYSNARIDNCGVCNGDNSTCKLVKSEFILPKNSYGYVDISTIPAAATNIKIKENGTPTNYIALLSNEQNILNGFYIFSHAATKKHDGSTLKYERSQKINRVTIDGPIDISIQLKLYVMKASGDSITYEYYVPNSYKGTVNKVAEYNWVVEAWRECTKSCATGERTRSVYCAKKDTQDKVEEFFCKKEQKPHIEEECNIQACPPRWYISQWSPCSKTCQVGIHTRRVHCVETIKDGNIQMLDFVKCPGKVPVTVDECVVQEKCPQWLKMQWTPCSKTCGEGVQSRTIHCMDTVKDNSVEEGQCSADTKPITEKKCFNAACGATWETEKWSECNSQCGAGVRSRTVICRNSQGIEVPTGHCNANEEPLSFDTCEVQGPCKPMWHATEWSDCTARCGYGMQMRMIVCAVMAPNDKKMTIVNDSLCVSARRPIKMRRCVNKKPCHLNYFVSKWQKCSASCGTGFQMRKVQCYADRFIDHSEKSCKNLQRPTSVRLCKNSSCEGGKCVDYIYSDFFEESSSIKFTTSSTTTTTTETFTTAKARTEYAARIVSLVGNVRVHANDNADYDCIATGDPKPSIKWTLHGKEITSSRFHKVNITGGNRLLVLAVSSEDAGELKCSVSNRHGEDSKSLQLRVSGPPEVLINPLNAEKEEGEQLIIRCTAEGSPSPRTQWTRDTYTSFYGDGNRVVVTQNRIVFKRVVLGDAGKYTCIGFNSAGSAKATATVVVKRSSERPLKKECIDDNTSAECPLIGKVSTLCTIPYYRTVCCATCTGGR